MSLVKEYKNLKKELNSIEKEIKSITKEWFIFKFDTNPILMWHFGDDIRFRILNIEELMSLEELESCSGEVLETIEHYTESEYCNGEFILL